MKYHSEISHYDTNHAILTLLIDQATELLKVRAMLSAIEVTHKEEKDHSNKLIGGLRRENTELSRKLHEAQVEMELKAQKDHQ